MKSYYFFIFSFLVLAPLEKLFAQQTITATLGEWPPISSQTLPHHGIGPHVVSAAFAKVGITVEYQWYPWSRAMKETIDSNADISVLWGFNDERAKNFYYSKPLLYSKSLFFYNKSYPLIWTDYSSFPKNMIVGITRGYSYGDDFDTAAKSGKITIATVNKDAQNLEKLIRNRINVFPGNELVIRYLLKTQFSQEQRDSLSAHPQAISNNPLHVIAPKNNQASLEKIKAFNKGFSLLSDSGELDKILDLYR